MRRSELLQITFKQKPLQFNSWIRKLNDKIRLNYKHVGFVFLGVFIFGPFIIYLDIDGTERNNNTIILICILITTLIGSLFIIMGIQEAIEYIKSNKKYPWHLIYQIVNGVLILGMVLYFTFKSIAHSLT